MLFLWLYRVSWVINLTRLLYERQGWKLMIQKSTQIQTFSAIGLFQCGASKYVPRFLV